ncbi:DNA cytosine methyltransferase [Acanthopleuribacter pedis]|uniref:Cytosine-specific methyltransferase n=1 Tax=Acanthopleuribacter pedis TaxID=442870 RepID=A0A8J7QNP9_9BACT|nr:DNA cytosine methyltransferase [Acanthopleuribacter pedis]MBO1322475.1 DNA cytosine methyltransferase [Acanthopleuribacter pedis]
MSRPIAIDLFAGAGGMSLGFEEAGFDIAAAVEIDPVHAGIHAYNFPLCTTIPFSVLGLSGQTIRDAAKLHGKPIDLVFGGAPCQGFSMIGQRSLDDPRNALVREFVRLIAELSPTYFVFENVKGLTLGKHRSFLGELLEAFEQVGYQVQDPWRILNACDFGAPQYRERLFLMGARKGHPLPDYPNPRTASPKTPNLLLPKAPNCAEALADLPKVERFPLLARRDWVHTDDWGQPSEYAATMRRIKHQDWGCGYRRNFDRKLLSSSMRTNHTMISQRRFTETEPGKVEPISRFFKLAPHGLSNTLRAGTDSARGAFTSPRPIHYAVPRCVTVREMARLHGFPDWFRFHATKWHGARQIGNAVPPPLARAIGEQILAVLEAQPTMPERILDLGDEQLLVLDMKHAAKYWGVPVPIAGRNKKSGAKKRKQTEIEALRIQ